MKLSLISIPLLVSSALLVAAGGCADSDDTTANAPPDAPEPDGSTTLPESGAPSDADVSPSELDAADAAVLDADAAPPRTCSDDGFCQTSLPAQQHTLLDVWTDGADVAWAVTKEGRILRWDGAAWSVAREGTDVLDAIWGSSPTDLWAGGTNGVLLHGQGPSSASITWTAVSPSPVDAGDVATPILTLWGTSSTDVWAGGGVAYPLAGRLYHFDGSEWTLDPTALTNVMYQKLWGTSPSDVWANVRDPAQGNVGLMRRTADGTWAKDPPSCVFYGPVGFGGNATNVMAAGLSPNGAKICIGTRDSSGDAGIASWTSTLFAPDGLDRTAIWSSGPSDVWVAGKYGRLDHWDGAAWKTMRITLDEIPFTNDFFAMFGRPGGDLWVVGAGIAYRKVLP